MPGSDPKIWREQKAAAERRMAVVDQQPPEWNALLQDFPHQQVATVADHTASPQEARRMLEERFGKAI